MDAGTSGQQAPARLAAWLLLAGQCLYIAFTLLHAGGDANNHSAIFTAYAHSDTWTAVHLGQFAAMAIMLSGLLTLFTSLDHSGAPIWLNRIGAAAAVAALALYGALQAVDGVALKQAVNAWLDAPTAERAARFASAETIRWLEWGMRTYHDFALGVALLVCAASVACAASIPSLIALPIGLSGFAYLAQGWIAGAEGFSPNQSIAIVAAWALSLVWMIWLALAPKA